jgi:transglutaminase-like putative cysteine protease
VSAVAEEGPAVSRAERRAAAALYAAAVWAFAVGRPAPGAWPFLAVAALAAVREPWPVPSPLVRAVRIAGRLWVGAVILFGAVNSLYPVIPERTTSLVALVAGYSLLALGAAFLWVPGSAGAGLLPVTVALLAVACLDPGARLGLPLAAAGAAGFAYLLASRRTLGPREVLRAGRGRGLALALVHGAAAVALAYGIIRLLPWAQPRVEEATARLLNPAFATSYAGFSETSSLGDIEQLALSRTVVLRVWTSAPRRLRARVLTQFTGRGWRGLPDDRRELVPLAPGSIPDPAVAEWLEGIPGATFGDAAVPEPTPRVLTRIAPVNPPPGVLFSPGAPRVVRVAAAGLGTTAGVLEAPPEAPGLYGMVHGLDDRVGAEFGGPEPAAGLRAVPANTDGRLRELARTLGEGGPDARARVARTVGYLGAHCRYSLAPGAFRTTQPVAEFVFDKRKGYCEYFASAAAVLLRLQGVPTRYVTGFNVTDDDFAGGHYVVREASAHAWIDAYLPGRGWVEVDPTPAAEYVALREPLRRSGLAGVWEDLNARVAGAYVALRYGTAGTRRVLPAVALLMAVVLVRRWAKSRRRRAGRPTRAGGDAAHVPPEITALLARVDRLWARRGFPRPPHRAPLEHLRSLPSDRVGPPALDATRAAVECYYRARFGGVTAAPDELAGLARRLAEAS